MDLSSFSSLAAHWPVDWIIIGAFTALVAFDAFRNGSRRGIAISLAFPVTFIAYGYLDQTAIIAPILKTVSFPLEQNAIAIGMLVILFLLFSRMGGSFFGGSSGSIQALITGIAAAIVAAVFWLQLAPLEALWHFGPSVAQVFGVSWRLWWLFGSYLALAFVRG